MAETMASLFSAQYNQCMQGYLKIVFELGCHFLNNRVPVRPQTKVAKSIIHVPNPGIKYDNQNLC